MPITNNNAAASSFSYINGNNPMREITDRLNDVGNYLGSSPINQTSVTNFGYLITLPPVSSLPSGVPTGSVAMSGSNAALKLYVYTGAGSIQNGWASASIGG